MLRTRISLITLLIIHTPSLKNTKKCVLRKSMSLAKSNRKTILVRLKVEMRMPNGRDCDSKSIAGTTLSNGGYEKQVRYFRTGNSSASVQEAEISWKKASPSEFLVRNHPKMWKSCE